LIDARFKNHPSIFTTAEQIENEALLEAELLTRDRPEHQTLVRTPSNPSDGQKKADDDPFGIFLAGSSTSTPTSKSQSTRIREEIEAFFKVELLKCFNPKSEKNIGGSLFEWGRFT
jgi:hypothetical protein